MASEPLAILGLCAALAVSGAAGAVEVHDLKGLEDIFGRYAPGGDCKRQPQILVDVSGLTFEGAGATEKATNPEWAVGYGGEGYEGPARWIFPFRNGPDSYPILMTFNDGKPGGLTITGHEEGYAGGPPFTPRNATLVKGSPYAKCQ